jgi:hypothetical protein
MSYFIELNKEEDYINKLYIFLKKIENNELGLWIKNLDSNRKPSIEVKPNTYIPKGYLSEVLLWNIYNKHDCYLSFIDYIRDKIIEILDIYKRQYNLLDEDKKELFKKRISLECINNKDINYINLKDPYENVCEELEEFLDEVYEDSSSDSEEENNIIPNRIIDIILDFNIKEKNKLFNELWDLFEKKYKKSNSKYAVFFSIKINKDLIDNNFTSKSLKKNLENNIYTKNFVINGYEYPLKIISFFNEFESEYQKDYDYDNISDSED